MRTSTRLVLNSATTYLRLATTFVLGIFLTWFLVGRVGLEVFGLISIAMGAFGLSSAIEGAINGSLNREFSAAIASGDPGRVRRTLSNAIVLALQCAGIILALSLTLAVLALFGVFSTPVGLPHMNIALAGLFTAEGIYIGIRLILAPYRQALYGDRRVGLDNLLMTLARFAHTFSAVLVFGLLMTGSPMHVQILVFAGVHGVLMLIDTVCYFVLARRLIPGMQFRIADIDREEYRAIRRNAMHTGQHLMLIDYATSFITILINLFFGVAYNGMWQIALQIVGHGRLLAEGALRGIDPIITHLKEAKREGLVELLMVRSIRYQLAVALPWVVLYIIFMEPILELWFGGRLTRSADLTAAGISVAYAIQMIGTLASLCLIGMVFRVTTRGLERSLYGMGHIASYAWAAKYAFVLNIALAITLFAVFRQPWMAAIPFMVVNFLYYDVIVLRAASRTVRFPVFAALLQSAPRPLLAAAILAAALLMLRSRIPHLTLGTLVILLAGTAAIYLPLVIGVIAVPDERRRLIEMVARGRRRLKPTA